MTQQSLDGLVQRAKRVGVSMAWVCEQAGVAASTVSRARHGADMKMGTFEKLRGVVEQQEASQEACSA